MRTGIFLLTRVTVILTVLAIPAVASAAPGGAGRGPGHGRGGHGRGPTSTELCLPYATTTVGYQPHQYVIRNDVWGDQQCIRTRGLRPGFRVQESSARATRQVVGFPDIFTGCSWGICSPGTRLPLRLSSLPGPWTTWYTSERARGTWNAAYDIWIARQNMRTGQANGAEVMIWLNTTLPRPGGQVVRIDGARWYLHYWMDGRRGPRWNYVQFRRVTPTWHVRHLRLGPFFRQAERMRLVSRRWYVLNIEAGFEIWRGGRGLSTSWFSVRL